MTILEPNKKRKNVGLAIILGAVFVLSVGILSIFGYNSNIGLRFAVNSAKEEIARLHAENAEFKDNLYKRLDFDDVEAAAAQLGLVKEVTPKYFLAFQ